MKLFKRFKKIPAILKTYKFVFLAGIVIGIIFFLSGKAIVSNTSTDKYCMSCHAHPHVEKTWRESSHYENKAGIIVHCVDCHLPPEGVHYLTEKTKHGIKDLYGEYFKDPEDFNWEAKSRLENAVHFTYQEGCIKCHQNLFPSTLTKEGDDAHLYFNQLKDEISCLNCHIDVGHYDENRKHEKNTNFANIDTSNLEIYTQATEVDDFINFTEKIPGTNVSFDMIAIPAGTFQIGSVEDEAFRQDDEGPVKKVKLKRLWMGKIEVSWDEYLAFFQATESEGRKEETEQTMEDVDAISGATPPWGAPDQGWGKGSRPAITMSHHAAMTYCRWLSKITGKKYRLPTEAEWEYACRAQTQTPYFFEGNPSDYSNSGFMNKLFGADTSIIASYAIYRNNSLSKTHEPEMVLANPFGLKNTLGNVREFCLDWYSPDVYSSYQAEITENPSGPVSGEEHVVRGGSFKSDASELRAAFRGQTQTKDWLVTDPQMPKSIWWYSDCIDVGFRVVCESDLK